MTCPRCAEPVGPTDRFCEGCGNDLQVERGGTVAAPAAATACTSCGTALPGSGPDADWCPRCGLRRRDGTDRVEIDLDVLAGVSDRGLKHARNEDAMALGRRTGGALAAVVCDGVSSVRTPELASRAATEAALSVLLGAGDGSPTDRTRAAITAAARAVAELAPRGARDAPSCTFVSAYVDRTGPGRPEVTVGWVGDSRAYWLAGSGAAEAGHVLTSDHSWAAEMVAAGILDEAGAAADSRAHAITRWLGADGEPEPDVTTLRPTGSGVLLLCSDGLWNYVPDAGGLAEIAFPVIARGGSPLDAATALTSVALEAGGRDNITVVLIPITFEELSPS